MNPFELKPCKLEKCFDDWKKLNPKPYVKQEVSPFTKLRIILMNGTEFEANWFSHQFSRHCSDENLRRELAQIRRIEQQQQKKISALKPLDETILETTIGYEQLAVELTAILAKNESDAYVKQALDFALLEDFDHLYRYANLLDYEHKISAANLVGDYTEIMPGRPTISEHRFPFDDIKRFTDYKTADALTKLNIGIITAAEQQTMNFYMNIGSTYMSAEGRALYSEIAMIEEQHVSHYGSLIDTNCTWLEGLLMHEYTECYLYYSMSMDETDMEIKKIWEECFNQEVAHLHAAARLLQKYEKKEWQQVIPNGEFPTLLAFKSNKEYVRKVLKSVNLTAQLTEYCEVSDLPEDYEFFRYNNSINKNIQNVASHTVVDRYIKKFGKDYRFEVEPHPISSLRERKSDNTTTGRTR